MKFLSSEKLSNHRYKTAEGYLICTDAIIARTGEQEYLECELDPTSDSTKVVRCLRPEEEVFSPETIASFENKPFTFDHPSEDVTPENYRELSYGFVRDVHRDGENLVANIVVTDPKAITAIENHEIEEVSCGYDCRIDKEADHYVQREIRGNHVALCRKGRAGNARIVDSSIRDWSMRYLGHTIEEVFFSYYDNGHYAVDGNTSKSYCFKSLEEAKEYIRSLRRNKHFFVGDDSDLHTYVVEYEISVNQNLKYSDIAAGEEEYAIKKKKETFREKSFDDVLDKHLPKDAMLIRIYKDGKLLKSFSSNQAGGWHGRGDVSQARNLDCDVRDSKKVYYVYNEDNDYWGPFNTVAEARQRIRENKKFDKEQGNPFDEVYRIEAEIEDCADNKVKDSFYTESEKQNKAFVRSALDILAKAWRKQNAK